MAKNDEKKELEDSWWRLPLLFSFQLSGWIVTPVIVALVLGWWLEKSYHFGSWIYLITVGVAFVVSMMGMVREGGKAIKTMDKIDREAKQKKDKLK